MDSNTEALTLITKDIYNLDCIEFLNYATFCKIDILEQNREIKKAQAKFKYK